MRRYARSLRDISLRYVHPIAPRVHYFLFFRVRRLLASLNSNFEAGRPFQLRQALYGSQVAAADWHPRVSVIVPAFNHEPFLAQRLDSIYTQTYTNTQVILLDDASSDGSTEILREWAASYPDKTVLAVNDINSGLPFGQWANGLGLATGDLIWIAESDDFCDERFLEHLVPMFADSATMLAFGRTVFTDEEGAPAAWNLNDYLPELGAAFWDSPFVTSAHSLVNRIWSRRNLIPNVSGLLFRANTHYPLLDNPQWKNLRICGDWWFYLALARGGTVAYSPGAINYYRQHQSNTSVSEHKSDRYMNEHLLVAERVLELYALSEEAGGKLRRELEDRWASHMTGPPTDQFTKTVKNLAGRPPFEGRKPNILMVTYALVPGGGEILPLRLANLLHEAGYAVSVLNCAQLPDQPGVRDMLNAEIPLIRLNDLSRLHSLLVDLGIELIHTHNAWADSTLCDLLGGDIGIPHVVTSHGMYDALDKEQLARLGKSLRNRICGMAYVADKNRLTLESMGFMSDALVKLPNIIDYRGHTPIDRDTLGVPEDAFLICLASRGIPEKGWQEAIAAIALARSRCERDIRLIILGEGPERSRLRQAPLPDWLQLPGFRANATDYFATADLGLLPSWFAGESQPLTLLECLAAGRPFLATDVGEIKNMLATPSGLAGTVIPLLQGRVDIELLADAIVDYASNSQLLAKHTSRIALVSGVHGSDDILQAHERFYANSIMQSTLWEPER